MAETHRTRSQQLTLMPVEQAEGTSAQDLRDLAHSADMRHVKIITSTDSPYTATDDDRTIEANATGGAITINLPAASGATHRKHTIIKSDVSVNAVTVDANSTELINGAETYVLDDQYDTVTIECNGTKWLITAKIAAD